MFNLRIKYLDIKNKIIDWLADKIHPTFIK